jgi:hypothetical protein
MAKAPLPKVVAVKVPSETGVPGQGVRPKLEGDAMATLVGMLERGEVRAAVAAARDLHGNDVRLALLGELLGVAEQLPLSITIAIAQSISIMDMEKARATLIDYRAGNLDDAHRVTRILAKRAPAVSAQLGQVFVPGIYSPPSRPVGRAGSRLGLSASLLLMGIAGSRCAISSHHTYDYPMPNLRAFDFKMPTMHLDPALFELSRPPTIDVLASPRQYFAQIVSAAGKIVRDGTPSQVLAARDVRNAALANDCGQLIDAASALADPSSTDPLVERSIAEISVRIDLVCPSP